MTTASLANQTLVGLPLEQVYGVAQLVMPDGTKIEKLVQKAKTPDGQVVWEEVDEKLKAFDERFKDTETVPGSWRTPNTATLTPKDKATVETEAAGGVTRIDMRRALILGLGDPQVIIANKGLDPQRLDHFKRSPSTLTLLHMMAKAHGGEWGEAAAFLKPVYPEVQ